MTGPAHVFLQVGGLRLHHLEWRGSGPPIVCLHGVTGHAWLWHDVAAELARTGHSVLSFDLRGHGDSQWSATGGYTTDEHVRDLETRLDLLGLDPVRLVGASWGGLIGLAFAATRPARVASLTLVDSVPAFAGSETDIPPRPRSFADHREVVSFERELYPHATDTLLDVVAAHGTRPGPNGGLERKHDPAFFSRWPFRADDRWAALERLDLPILVVHAGDSEVVSRKLATAMVERAHNAQLVEISECRHVIPVERPHELARAIARFTDEEER